jgi:hypothetical protein
VPSATAPSARHRRRAPRLIRRSQLGLEFLVEQLRPDRAEEQEELAGAVEFLRHRLFGRALGRRRRPSDLSGNGPSDHRTIPASIPVT